MRLLVASHKPCWSVAGQLATDGGFPVQIKALSELFDGTRLIVTKSNRPAPQALAPLEGHGLDVVALPEPTSAGALRKAELLGPWFARHRRILEEAIREADVVHTLVPSDLGFLATVLARRHPRLFVRHCGTWGHRGSIADRLLAWWLPRLARSGAVVFATGSGTGAPPPGSPNLHWIFSTSLTEARLRDLGPPPAWQPTHPPRLVTIGRLTRGKNQAAAIEAMQGIRRQHPGAILEILGDGPARHDLEALVATRGLSDAVHIRGNVSRSEVIERLRSSQIFVFPTRVAEGFPKAVLEALACGVPVLAPAVSVIPRLLADGGGRVLVGTEPEDLAAAVLALLDAPELLPAMGAAGRATASRYTLERWRDEIGAVIEERWGPLRAAPAP